MAYKVTNRATGSTFSVESGETILAAAQRNALHLPYSCQNGTCASCKAQVLSGELCYPRLPPNALSEAERQAGLALLCQAVPQSDLTIVAREVSALKDIQPRKLPARIKAINLVADEVVQLQLGLPKGISPAYLAGQYLDVLLANDRRRAFSIANAPGTSEFVELHIRRVTGGGFTDQLFTDAQVGDLIRVELPLGTFFLRDRSPRPMICVAGGTGFAPIKAIIEQTLVNEDRRPLRFYWGARTERELYLRKLIETWADRYDHLSFIPVLSDADKQWTGRSGLVHEAVIADHADLSIFDLYMSGPPALVAAGRRSFVEHGLVEHHLYYDSFEFAADVMAQLGREHLAGEAAASD